MACPLCPLPLVSRLALKALLGWLSPALPTQSQGPSSQKELERARAAPDKGSEPSWSRPRPTPAAWGPADGPCSLKGGLLFDFCQSNMGHVCSPEKETQRQREGSEKTPPGAMTTPQSLLHSPLGILGTCTHACCGFQVARTRTPITELATWVRLP